jgi:hypothetical protein
MSAQQPQPKRTILTDGELLEAPDTPEMQVSAVYCSNCGAANRATARFCRTCGESLDEQTPNADSTHTYGAPGQKLKRRLQPVSQPQAAAPVNVWSVLLELVTLFFVIGMIATTAHFGSAVPITVLVAWILVEAIRHGVIGRRRS